MPDDTCFRSWKENSRGLRHELGHTTGYAPWTSPQDRPPPKLLGAPRSQRVLDVLDVGWMMALNEQADDWWVDFTQDASMTPWGKFSGQCTKSCFYSYKLDRCLAAPQNFLLHGWPLSRTPVSNMSAAQVRDLAGDAMFLPHVACLMAGFFLNPYAPWWSGERHVSPIGPRAALAVSEAAPAGSCSQEEDEQSGCWSD